MARHFERFEGKNSEHPLSERWAVCVLGAPDTSERHERDHEEEVQN